MNLSVYFLIILTSVNSVLLELQQYETTCLSIDLDSHKMVIVQAQIKHQPECEVELYIDSNSEVDILENKLYKRRKYERFNCQNLPKSKYIQKFAEQATQRGLNKFRVCVESKMSLPVVISLSIREVITPQFQQFQDQQLSLVSSSQLLLLRERMTQILKGTGRMEPMGLNYMQTQEIVYRTYRQQKQTINFITKLQIGLIVMIGLIWLLAFQALQHNKN